MMGEAAQVQMQLAEVTRAYQMASERADSEGSLAKQQGE